MICVLFLLPGEVIYTYTYNTYYTYILTIPTYLHTYYTYILTILTYLHTYNIYKTYILTIPTYLQHLQYLHTYNTYLLTILTYLQYLHTYNTYILTILTTLTICREISPVNLIIFQLIQKIMINEKEKQMINTCCKLFSFITSQ